MGQLIVKIRKDQNGEFVSRPDRGLQKLRRFMDRRKRNRQEEVESAKSEQK